MAKTGNHSDSIQLTEQEAIQIKQQLVNISQIDQQIAKLHRELTLECHRLEIIWQSIYRRNLLEKIRQDNKIKEIDLRVPPAIENGKLRIEIAEEHMVRVVRNG